MFDCQPQDLIITRLHVYDADYDILRLMRSYLSN